MTGISASECRVKRKMTKADVNTQIVSVVQIIKDRSQKASQLFFISLDVYNNIAL